MARCKYTRDAKGYFQTKVWDGSYTESGSKRRITLRTTKSSAALEKMVDAFKREVEEGKVLQKTDETFFEYAKIWMKVYKSSKEKNTQAMYKNIIEKHFSFIDWIKLQDITRIHYMLLINNAKGKACTQRQIHLVFKQVLKSAVADQLYPISGFENIFANVEKIKYSPGEKRPLTRNEKKAVFEADLDPQDKAFVYILYGCGLRRGEALALTRFNIDLEKRILSVQRSLAFDVNDPYVKSTKTENGERSVPIPDKIYPFIKTYVESLPSEKLFYMADGGWITKSSYRKKWERIIKRLQAVCNDPIIDLTAHVFRHNYCTNLCYQIPAISIKKIAELMGDTEKMVIEVYNHIILEKEDAAAAVGNALNF